MNLEQPSLLLGHLFNAMDLILIDTLPALRAALTRQGSPFGRVDPHLSPEGHRVVAETVAPVLLRALRAVHSVRPLRCGTLIP